MLGLKTLLRVLILLLLIVNLSSFIYVYTESENLEKVLVTRAIDGDTIETVSERVRLLDINTPERGKAGYEEAKNFLAKLDGSEVELYGGGYDKYSRKLAYVFFEGKLVNEEILELGLGTLYYYDKGKYTERLEKAEKKARDAKIGLWARSEEDCGKCIELIEIENDPFLVECEAKFEFVKIRNKCDFDCDLSGWEMKDDANHIYKFEMTLEKDLDVSIFSSDIQRGCQGVWNDDRDSVYIRDKEGKLVIFQRY
ncbi:MAG: thermonuclease family protein [archaeon]